MKKKLCVIRETGRLMWKEASGTVAFVLLLTVVLGGIAWGLGALINWVLKIFPQIKNWIGDAFLWTAAVTMVGIILLRLLIWISEKVDEAKRNCRPNDL